MSNSNKSGLLQLRIYQKSLDIFKLSRSIASYISNDSSILNMYQSKNNSYRFADNLVMNALGLVPKIVETENQKNPSLKLKYAKSLRFFIDGLYYNCLQLESSKIQGLDFVKMLRKELKKLRTLHSKYVKSLY